MAFGFAVAAIRDPFIHFEVCPNWDAQGHVCDCPKDGDGNPVPPHPVYDFADQSPDGRTQNQWAVACANEVKLIIREQYAVPQQDTVINAIQQTSFQ